MSKQKIFRKSYIRKLQDQLDNEENLNLYTHNEFIFDETQTLIMPELKQPFNLYARMKADNDFKSAVQLYEAYEDLSPIQASDQRLWTYLSHVDLYPYMYERWQSKKSKDYVMDHWFLDSSSQSNLLSDNLSGLWWAVHISIDKTRIDKYELTEILFKARDFTFRTFGTSKFARYKEAALATLEFIKENEHLFENKFQAKSRLVSAYVNLYGGTKPLSFFKKNQIKSVLEDLKPKLSKM